MAEEAIKARLRRLIAGDVRPDDLTHLFLFLRFHSYGHSTVKEIGDFAAHSDIRQKGITTDRIRDFFNHYRFLVPYIFQKERIDLRTLPKQFPDAIRGNLRRAPEDELKKSTGLKPSSAKKTLEEFLVHLVPVGSGSFSLKAGIYPKTQMDLVQFLSYNIFLGYAFDDNILFNEFIAVLLKNGLADRSELTALQTLKPIIALYAVSIMHQSSIDLGDETKASLTASFSPPKNKIEILADTTNGLGGSIHKTMFLTGLDATEHCETELTANPGGWKFAIELNTQKRLGRLR